MADIEKAINDLEEIKGKLIPAIARMYGSGFSSVFACENAEEKINNAIELLKQQNGLMLALEQSNASNEYLNNSVSELGETINILKDEIKRLKEQQPKWIPSSERLPEMFKDVLVYGSFGYEIMHIEDSNFNGGVEWCNNHDYFVPVCDTIWIALSELWKFANADKKEGEKE